MGNKYYTDERSQQIVISLLKAHGIKKVVASPGATNITLVGSIQNDPYFEVYSCVDERSAAYLACGLSAETGEAVVLSCTGATASRNYMPGLTEAYYRKLPILAITSSQEEHRIGHLHAQAIDRTALPNDIAKLSVNIPVSRTKDQEWNCEIKVNKALLELKHHGGGPVHINLATAYSRNFLVKDLPQARAIYRYTANDTLPSLPDGKIALFMGSHKQCSPVLENAIDQFCAAHDAVVFCDHTSGYNGKYKVLSSLIGSQENGSKEILSLNLLIHMGEISGDYPTLGGLKANEVWRLNEDGELRDYFRKLRAVFEMDDYSFLKAYTPQDFKPRNTFLTQNKEAYQIILEKLPELPFGNIWVASKIAPNLPAGSVLHLGILNSLRSWNLFELPQSVRSYSNVGGFGTDGILSSLVGASLANSQKLYFAVLGDLAFFYDMNSLGIRHIKNNIRILLINNGKGTEFTNYGHAGAEFGEDANHFIAAEGHNGRKSTALVKHYAEDLGFEYLTASSKESFEEVYSTFTNASLSEKPIIFEVFTDSEEESIALETVKKITTDSKTVIKGKVKEAIKSVLGKDIIAKIKDVRS